MLPSRGTANDVALSIRNLTVGFGPGGSHHVVEGVGFDVRRGEIFGLVGESGSGKTITALSVLGLLPHGGKVLGGSIRFLDDDLLRIGDRKLSRIRGNKVAMIFQDPSTAMNPVIRVGNQVAEPLVTHRNQSWRSARASAVELLRKVHIPGAADRASAYPFQYSGGMLQRATIAMALACNPELIIADEPTTALDVTIQAQILELLREIRRTHHATILLITHDLGVVAELCDRVGVMYAGRIMEVGTVDQIFTKPLHPYTGALLRATPRMDRPFDLESVPNVPPRTVETVGGCRFADRCPFRFERCASEPDLLELEADRAVRCWLVEPTA